MFKKGVVIAAGLLVAGVANAQGYVDVHLGQAKVDWPSVSGLTLDDTDTTYSLKIGFKLNDIFAIEGGYTQLGETSYTASAAVSGSANGYTFTDFTGKVVDKVDGYAIGLAADFPVSNAIDLSARAGVYFWDWKETGTITGGSLTYGGTTYLAGTSISVSDDGSDLYWGLGASYKFNKAVRAGVNFTRYDIDGTDVDTWTASLRYNF